MRDPSAHTRHNINRINWENTEIECIRVKYLNQTHGIQGLCTAIYTSYLKSRLWKPEFQQK